MRPGSGDDPFNEEEDAEEGNPFDVTSRDQDEQEQADADGAARQEDESESGSETGKTDSSSVSIQTTVSDGSGVSSVAESGTGNTGSGVQTTEEESTQASTRMSSPANHSGSENSDANSGASGGSASTSLLTSPEVAARQNIPDEYDVDLPWAVGRQNVKTSRSEEKTFFLQEQIAAEGGLEDQAKAEVEEILGGSVSRTDLREAAVVLSYSNPKALAALLSEWGAEHA